MAEAAVLDKSNPAAEAPFIKELIKIWRAQDTHGTWDDKGDLDLLEPYIIDKERAGHCRSSAIPTRKPFGGWSFFSTRSVLSIERATGVMISPMLKMSHEGFGRMVLIGGRLIVVNKQLRDVHRFGFDSLAKLAEEGDKYVKAGVEMINKFPDVAKY